MTRDARQVELDLVAYYDQEADFRAGQPLDGPRLEARSEFLSRWMPPSGRMLEVGTGAGRDTGYFAEQGVDIHGIDLSNEQLRHAQAAGGLVALASVRALPFPDETFDAVWTMSTLMHVPDSAIESALAELRRVLAPGAVAAIGVWGGPDIEEPVSDEKYEPPRFFSRRSDERWQDMLTSLGRVEDFRTGARRADAFWYQWAIIRRD